MDKERRPFQGVLNILSFNRHYYVWGLVALVMLLFSRYFFPWPDVLFWIIIFSFVYGLIMPLLVSAYVYDFSGYYRFEWLDAIVSNAGTVRTIVNINAGFDETSFIVNSRFPKAEIRVFDFYDDQRHTEPAIKRARKVSLVYPGTKQIASNAIPVKDETADIVLLLSAVHEIRMHAEKITFLKECRRICKPVGKVIMVEHLRDLPNFMSFTVGFTHFFPRAVWRDAFEKAGFHSFEEKKFTPFMSVFTCKP